jgi:hypothetical protein
VKARLVLVLAACAAAVFILAPPAGAALSAVGHVTVDNSSPARASTIDVASNGWRRGAVVSISLSGSRVLGRAIADASGGVHARVLIPDDAPRFATLAVIGSAATGVPQQITTNLVVVGTHRVPTAPRPWTVICLILAIATLLLLAGVRSDAYPATSSGLRSAPG